MGTLLTDKKINSLKPGQWATESSVRGAGQLQARGLRHKRVAYYFRYTGEQQKQIRIPLGSELSLAEARRKATVLSRQHQEGYLLSKASHKVETVTTTSPAKPATFGTLLFAYVEDLHRRGCSSTQEVNNAFQKHIHHTWPELWNLPVGLITTDHILQMVRCVAEQNKLRAADKLRCYIRAAYAAAIQARQHIVGLSALIALKISSNPARDIPPIRQSSQTKDRVLSLAELQTYWQHISQMDNAAGALLQFHLLTGGQRIQQLARLTLQDYDADSQTLTVKDPKGRRHQPRLHIVPILPQAKRAMEHMLWGYQDQSQDLSKTSTYNANNAKHTGTSGSHVNQNTHDANCTHRGQHTSNEHPIYLWTVTQGQYGACYSTASKALKQVIEQVKRREAKNGEGGSFLADFTLGDLRRTIETRLAAAGVSRETRAQLQSHGLSGVQVRHYDRHDYLKEKKEALEILYKLLTEPLMNEALVSESLLTELVVGKPLALSAPPVVTELVKPETSATQLIELQQQSPTAQNQPLLTPIHQPDSGKHRLTAGKPPSVKKSHGLKPIVQALQTSSVTPASCQEYLLPHRAGP